MGLQAIVNAVYPPACACCGTTVASDGGLCGSCFGDMTLLAGLVCDACGCALPGTDTGALLCDQCMENPRPWDRGRAVAHYSGTARRLVLSLKHGDRSDLARPLARWLDIAIAPVARKDFAVVPVPLHRVRLIKRRYNQAAEVARHLARIRGCDFVPDALARTRATPIGVGVGRQDRVAHLQGAIAPGPHGGDVTARHVLLVDDVMASGATLTACARALRECDPASITIGVVARAARAI